MALPWRGQVIAYGVRETAVPGEGSTMGVTLGRDVPRWDEPSGRRRGRKDAGARFQHVLDELTTSARNV